ncbi:MAG: hypothetical protein RQ735_00070 [Flavobacteriaceae bacterium]|nr:hypothetical protein [Flavobacteriaceae bacterium]
MNKRNFILFFVCLFTLYFVLSGFVVRLIDNNESFIVVFWNSNEEEKTGSQLFNFEEAVYSSNFLSDVNEDVHKKGMLLSYLNNSFTEVVLELTTPPPKVIIVC